ncbi:MAG: hypothetical protein JJW00_09965 [Sulfurimonas sp.]|nr:hypothetical protein [Sulfurimonas sp.]
MQDNENTPPDNNALAPKGQFLSTNTNKTQECNKSPSGYLWFYLTLKLTYKYFEQQKYNTEFTQSYNEITQQVDIE